MSKIFHLGSYLTFLFMVFRNKGVIIQLFHQGSLKIIRESLYFNRVIFRRLRYIKKKLHLIVKLPDYNLEKTFDQKAPGDWSNQIDFEISENYNKLYHSKIEVDIYGKKLFKEHHSGKIVINLAPLESHNEFIENECTIELDSKREGINCSIDVKIRKALKEKEYKILRKNKFSISRIYPPFK